MLSLLYRESPWRGRPVVSFSLLLCWEGRDIVPFSWKSFDSGRGRMEPRAEKSELPITNLLKAKGDGEERGRNSGECLCSIIKL